jgi:hypothetical protein
MAIFVENSDLKGYIHTQVNNDKHGCRELLRWLKENGVDASPCTYGMEHTGFYSDGLQHFLDKKGYKYTMLEPAVIKHYPIQPREKNDRLDAAKIADYLYRFRDTIQLSRVPDKTMEELRKLHRERKFYVEDRVCYLNRRQVVDKDEAKRLDKMIELLDKQIDTIEEKIRQIIQNDKALMEKINGISRREKYRIRYYNGDTSVIHLEKKTKTGNLGNKQSAPLTAEQAQRIAGGDTGWMLASPYPLVRELYSKMTLQGLAPKTIVDYTREPFVFPAGNVRVTLDYNIRSGLRCTDFLDLGSVTVPVSDAVILEVKWDAFIPDIIRDAVSLADRREGAFSKYAACRIYG